MHSRSSKSNSQITATSGDRSLGFCWPPNMQSLPLPAYRLLFFLALQGSIVRSSGHRPPGPAYVPSQIGSNYCCHADEIREEVIPIKRACEETVRPEILRDFCCARC